MTPAILKLAHIYLKVLIPHYRDRIYENTFAVVHRRRYIPRPDAKNIVIIGGSFAGVELVRRLIHSVPTGHKVILIEKNSHFHHAFNFPRYSVVPGRERKAFVPYDGIAQAAPPGIFELVHGNVVDVKPGAVCLASGDEIEYAILAVAVGSEQSPPARMQSSDRDGACKELQAFQNSIQNANKIAVVGGGAVGVELAADIKSFYPKKTVTLVHSRERLMSRFRQALGDFVKNALEELGVEVVLGERCQVLEKASHENIGTRLGFRDGSIKGYDLVIRCTGQSQKPSVLANLSPSSLCPSTGAILVDDTLQLRSSEQRNVFAFGDCSAPPTSAPKMAQAGFFQAQTVCANILSLARGEQAQAQYTPQWDIEGAIKLTLGLSNWVAFSTYGDDDHLLLNGKDGRLDLSVEWAWRRLGVPLSDGP